MEIVEFVYALLFCPQYRPLLILLIALGALIGAGLLWVGVFGVRWRQPARPDHSHGPMGRAVATQARRYQDVQQAAYARRYQAASDYLQDVKEFLGGDRT